MSSANVRESAEIREAVIARRRAVVETIEGIRLDSVESVDRWNGGERPACGTCGFRASWSTVVSAWIHLSPAFVDGRWEVLNPDHSVGAPTWGPK